MDNMRNLSLVLMNTTIMNRYLEKNTYVALDTYKRDEDISVCHDICKRIYEVMEKLCFGDGLDDQMMDQIRYVLDRILPLSNQVIDKTLRKNDPVLNTKSFRNTREIDSYLENYITMEYAIDQLTRQNPDISKKDIYYSGICYGGIELPFLAENIIDSNYYNIKPSMITLGGDYKSRHTIGSSEEVLYSKGIDQSEKSHRVVADDLIATRSNCSDSIKYIII